MSWFIAYSLVEWGIRLVMLPVIVRRQLSPATSLAWLSLVIFVPVIGLVAYILIGENRLAQRRVREHRRHLKSISSSTGGGTAVANQDELVSVNRVLQPVILQAKQISGMPILGGNHIELLSETTEMIDRLIQDIHQAQHHVHLMYYIFRHDDTGQRVADALIQAAQRGVECRLLADAAGSWSIFRRKGLARYLNDRDVQTHKMLEVAPWRRKLARIDLRNHRKIAIIDGTTAYTGSQNIVDADYGNSRAGQWIDLTGRFQGPVVSQLQEVFVADWWFETKQELDGPMIYPDLKPQGTMIAQTVPTGPTQESETLLRVMVTAINAAQSRIVITSAYLIPDEPTVLALSMAADRGVQVDLVIPHRSDHPLVSAAGRDYFDPLLDAGVNIYRHSPGLLHAKTMTVDDTFALLGSSNLDIRSFYLNFEINVLLYDPQVTQELLHIQTQYIQHAKKVDLDEWHQRSNIARFIDSCAALWSPLL